MYLETISFAVQLNVSISLLWFLFIVYSLFFSDAAGNEQSWLVEIPVERSIFECNIQKSVPVLSQLKNIMLPLRI